MTVSNDSAANMADRADGSTEDIRQYLQTVIDRLDHVLPGQAPLLNFVHHNTLHGFQHLPFAQGLEAFEKLTGIHGYLPEEEFKKFYAQGRITDLDLNAAFARKFDWQGERITIGLTEMNRLEVYRIALLFGIDPIAPSQFNWQLEEMDVLRRFQPDIPLLQREKIMQGSVSEEEAIQKLWNTCLNLFSLGHYRLHPEELTHIPLQKAEGILAEFDVDSNDSKTCAINPGIHHLVRAESLVDLAGLLGSIGKRLSLRELLLSLTGTDLLDSVRPMLIRFCAAHLDEGVAAWRTPDNNEGLYAAWKRCASADYSWALDDLPGWQAALARLPVQSIDAVVMLLAGMEIPQTRWAGYLERLALETPGWSGIINWRVHHPEYPANRACPVSLTDFLAIRLFLDSLWIEKICRETWGQAGRLTVLKAFFERYSSEFLARRMLYAGELPEYLANAVQKLVGLSHAERSHHEIWRNLADMVWTWKHSPVAEKSEIHTVYRSVWRLFRLCQHLGLDGETVGRLSLEEAEGLLRLLDYLSPSERGQLWLLAYENHYREELFTALSQNHGRGRWAKRDSRPQAQVIFCMDDREESIRRHLEEVNPAIETLGAAGFFGIPMNWLGLDDTATTPLCPVFVTPAHEIQEQPQSGQETLRQWHDRRRFRLQRFKRLINQELRRNLVTSNLLAYLVAPLSLAVLAAKVFLPRHFQTLKRKATDAFIPRVPTSLHLTAADDSPAATAEQPRLGFTIAEQTERVAGFLRNIGLNSNFAPLVVLSGHGSSSQNNPHLAAYDCGACSGRHGGPNARAFAAMANCPEVRKRLEEQQNIHIPKDTWFLGSEHDTCNEAVTWYDLDELPRHFSPALEALRKDLDRALLYSAHERCRRFASAPRRPSLTRAMRHVQARSADFSQARPELGHATNAAALIGRRAVTRGTFFDRRIFLISYDPTQDSDGKILEGILLAVGPVGAGINLEYYFSTVNNDRFGCGSKVPHNVTGMFGVMEGACGDLRTGLPRQMIEIHEAMRLQVVVESRQDTLAAIYRRQPILRELIGNGWLLLSVVDPDNGTIAGFDPQQGFIAWAGSNKSMPRVERSVDWYDGHSGPCPPALIRWPDEH